MHQLETLIQAIPPAVFAAGGSLQGSSAQIQGDPASSPLASFASSTHTYPSGVPPPSLHVFPLMNPSTHFTAAHTRPRSRSRAQSPNSVFQSMLGPYPGPRPASPADEISEQTSRVSLSASYLYIDDEGYTRWQGETSGLPLLDLLVENHTPSSAQQHDRQGASSPDPIQSNNTHVNAQHPNANWFPNRTPRRTDINPQTMWQLITSYIVPDLMDRYGISLRVIDFISK